MGKTWLYHPVSVMTIRGAAAQCGFTLGRVTQSVPADKENSAQYRAEVTAWPVGWEKKSQAVMKAWFNNCFNVDIWCTWAGMNSHGKWCVNITTQLVNDDIDRTEQLDRAEIDDLRAHDE